MGGKPINNMCRRDKLRDVYDGAVTHAYDYDKLRGHKRRAEITRWKS